ncbi:MAG: PKD domain-containing protein, partial [Planctomycetes bacterium]|nr:PKD domain-containing protein [Planctomycetota bacterium]
FQVGEPAPPPTSACFSASATSGLAPLSVDFDASCSFFASPAVCREWTFGDGGTASGVAVSHTFPAGGEYQVTLTVKDQDGATASASKTITVFERASSFADDFDRPDGPIDGWTVFSVPGTWNIASGELHTGPTGEERWIWAGRPAFLFPNRLVLELDMRFLGPGTNAAVGRHAGAVFCANKPTHRYDPTFTGYFIDWIDRSSDHGLRFTRVDAGQLVEIVRGAPGSPAEPPLVWRVEITGQNIRVFGDGTLYIDLVDGTYRGGHVGLWTWAGGQDVAFDNVSVSEPSNPLTACFTYSAAGYAVAGADIAFNATCSENVGAGTVSHSWDFGDGSPAGSSPEVAHAYAAPGRYTVKLTLTDTLGNTAATSQEVVVYQRALAFSDDFERADGPVTGWTVFSVPGTWTISSGELLTGPTNEERWVWAGDTPVLFPKDVVIEWDQTFRGPGTIPVVGRHAGMVFCGSRATHRGDPAFSGYFVDWIDRTDDRGLRFTRVDGGRFVEIIRGQASIPVPDEPPVVWRVELDGDHIKLFGDETLYIDLVDGTYRGGFAGLWTWAGGQEVSYDNFAVTGSPITACFTTSPSVLTTGATVSFDASCSEVFGGAVSSYEWDFGDGGTTAGATASHAYAAAGDVTVKLTVRDGAGGSDVLERRLTVHEALLPFADCFDRAAGPAGGWTAASGTWNITAEGDVETVTGGEAFLYAGDPPRPLVGDFVAEVDWQLLGGTHPVVGRHAALHFFWNLPTTNRFGGDSRGYSVFYIDRAGDRGLTLARWDFGPLTVLNPPGGTPAFSEPPAKLRIEVTGPRIRVFADGEVAIDVEDATYRDGLFALWSWNENTVRFDDVLVGQTELPTCDVVPPEPRFVRGDADATGVINLTDALRVLLYLFSGGAEPPCFDAADADDNGQLQLTDAIRILGWLFLGNPAPLPPSPSVAEFPPADCGVDPSADELGCAAFPPCP